MVYSEKLMEHFINPMNVGEIENADGIGEAGGSGCGDAVKMYISVENGIITDVKCKTCGCSAAIAASSISTELIKGRTLKEALELTNEEVAEALGGLPAEKLRCSVLAEQAVKAAVENYLGKRS